MQCIPQNDIACFYNNNKRKGNFKIVKSKIDNFVSEMIATKIDPNFKKLYDERCDNSKSLLFIFSMINNVNNISSLANSMKYLMKHDIPILFTLSIIANPHNPKKYTLLVDSLKPLATIANVDLVNLMDFLQIVKKHICADSMFVDDNLLYELLYFKCVNDNDDNANYRININKLTKHPIWKIVFDDFLSQNDIIVSNTKIFNLLDAILTYEHGIRIIKNIMTMAVIKKFYYCLSINKYVISNNIYERPNIATAYSPFIYVYGDIIDMLYEKHFFDNSKLDKITEIFNNIKQTAIESIANDSNISFSKSFRDTIIKKIKNIVLITNANKTINVNDEIINGNEFYQILLNVGNLRYLNIVKKISTDCDKYNVSINGDIYSFHINMYYDTCLNMIYLPTSMMDDVFININESDAYNYGGIGSMIGHEIMHSIDSHSIHHDFNGILNYWISDDDMLLYQHNIIDKLYSNYSDSDFNLNMTESENISDILGLKICLKTFIKKCNRKNIHIFFMRWATIFDNDNTTHLKKVFDEHAPKKIRVNAPMGHLIEYYKLFDVNESHANYINKANRITYLD